MGFIVKDDKKKFNPAPEGLHAATCCDVIDLGEEDTKWGKKSKLRIMWVLDEIDPETGKQFMVGKKYTTSLNDKSNLCIDLQCWRGRKFTEEEKQGFDLERLLGAGCQLQIVHELGDNSSVYANVQAIVPLSKQMTKPAIPKDYVRKKDRDSSNGNGNGKEVDGEHSSTPF